MTKAEKENNNTANKKKLIASVILAFALGVIVFFLFSGKQTTIKTQNEDFSYVYLSCTKDQQGSDDTFTSSTALKVNEELRASFTGGSLNDITFIFQGDFPSTSAAESAGANMVAEYDTYIGKTGGSRSTYNPHYSTDGSKMTFRIYAESSEILSGSKAMFFLTENDDPKNTTTTALKQSYEAQGFTCSIDN